MRLPSTMSSSAACRIATVTKLSYCPLDTSRTVVTPQNTVCTVLPANETKTELIPPLISPKIDSLQRKSTCPLLFNFLHPHFTLFLWSPGIFLSTLISPSQSLL